MINAKRMKLTRKDKLIEENIEYLKANYCLSRSILRMMLYYAPFYVYGTFGAH